MKKAAVIATVFVIIISILAGCSGTPHEQNAPEQDVQEQTPPLAFEIPSQGKQITPTPPETQESSSIEDEATKEKTYTLTEIIPEIPIKDAYMASELIFSEGMCLIKYNNLYGYLNSDGKVVIEPIYARASPFSDGLAVTQPQQDRKISVINTSGDEVYNLEGYEMDILFRGFSPYINPSCYYHQSRVILKTRSGYHSVYSVFDTSGRKIYDMEDRDIFDDEIGYSISAPENYYSCDRMVWRIFKDSDFVRIIDKEGNMIAELPAYSWLKTDRMLYSDNLLTMPSENEKWGVVDINGNVVIDFTFEELGFAKDGLIPFLKYGKWGYIDYTGQVVIEEQYESATEYNTGLAAVKLDGKWGYINLSGEFVIQPTLNTDSPFYDNGTALVGNSLLRTKFIIDREGNVITPETYGELLSYTNTYGNMVIMFKRSSRDGPATSFHIYRIEELG